MTQKGVWDFHDGTPKHQITWFVLAFYIFSKKYYLENQFKMHFTDASSILKSYP